MFKLLGKLNAWIDGNKTYIAGVAVILTGVAEILSGFSENGTFNQNGWEKVLAGWTIIAGRSAIKKIVPKGETK